MINLNRWRANKSFLSRVRDGFSKNDWSSKKPNKAKIVGDILSTVFVSFVGFVYDAVMTEKEEKISSEETSHQGKREK